MVQYWIFVSQPFSDFNRGNIIEVMSKGNSEKKWPIGKRTHKKKLLSKSDKILFYEAGAEGQKIFGSGELLSGLKVNKEEVEEFVIIGNFKIWNPPTSIRGVISNLSFIKNVNYWGLYFQGGIVPINESDFNILLNLKKGKNI